MINKAFLIKYFEGKDEKILFSKILDKAIFCQKNHQPTFTEFLPIIHVVKFIEILNLQLTDLNVKFFGGFTQSERVIIGFTPEYIQLEETDFPITAIKISYKSKYSKKLTHRDFLGSILASGINRTKVGDLIVKDDYAICIIEKDISSYLQYNLTKVSNTPVNILEINIKNYDFTDEGLENKSIIVSSIRLDNVLSVAFNLSRSKVANLIKSEKAFINWKVQTNCSKNIDLGDFITLRGFGRIKINQIEGKTRKDKIILNILSSK